MCDVGLGVSYASDICTTRWRCAKMQRQKKIFCLRLVAKMGVRFFARCIDSRRLRVVLFERPLAPPPTAPPHTTSMTNPVAPFDYESAVEACARGESFALRALYERHTDARGKM